MLVSLGNYGEMDVKNAFLHGEVDRDIYMEQPKGFESKDQVELCVQATEGSLWI